MIGANLSDDDKSIRRNVMTISWLTPIDNYGNFICSINKKRHTSELITETRKFVLNVPVHGQESLIVSIGSCSGRHGDKFDLLDLSTTVPGSGIGLGNGKSECIRDSTNRCSVGVSHSAATWPSTAANYNTPPDYAEPGSVASSSARRERREMEEKRDNSQLIALEDVAAHIVCTVEGVLCNSPGALPSTPGPSLAADEKESGLQPPLIRPCPPAATQLLPPPSVRSLRIAARGAIGVG
jgi:hypothetical protein